MKTSEDWAAVSKLERILLSSILCFVLFHAAASAFGEDAYSVQPARPRVSRYLPENLVHELSPAGFRVLKNDNETHSKTPICEVFWARNIAIQTRPTTTSLLYTNLKTGGFIGVIHFLVIERYVRDYRTQMIKPGFYTMRYAAMPEGTNGSMLDFVLLSPVSADRNSQHITSLDELAARGRQASHTKRPLMMSLVEIDNDQAFPSLITDEEGTSVLQVKLQSKSAKTGARVPVALVVVTSIPEDLGD